MMAVSHPKTSRDILSAPFRASVAVDGKRPEAKARFETLSRPAALSVPPIRLSPKSLTLGARRAYDAPRASQGSEDQPNPRRVAPGTARELRRGGVTMASQKLVRCHIRPKGSKHEGSARFIPL